MLRWVGKQRDAEVQSALVARVYRWVDVALHEAIGAQRLACEAHVNRPVERDHICDHIALQLEI